MAQTERSNYLFRVKEFGDGTPWIYLEPRDKDLSCLGDGFLGLDLAPETDIQKAEEIVALLNKYVTSVSYTSFEADRLPQSPN